MKGGAHETSQWRMYARVVVFVAEEIKKKKNWEKSNKTDKSIEYKKKKKRKDELRSKESQKR